jgi:hypothetical protein
MGITDDERSRGAAGNSVADLLADPNVAEGIKEKLRALSDLANRPDTTITATINPEDQLNARNGILFSVTILGTDSKGITIGEPIQTTSGVIHMIDPIDKANWPIRMAFNTALRTVLFAQPHTAAPTLPETGK